MMGFIFKFGWCNCRYCSFSLKRFGVHYPNNGDTFNPKKDNEQLKGVSRINFPIKKISEGEKVKFTERS
ncbi:MAG: hypothetical protein CM15mP32_5950 [Flavobacteriaceae bacterium]|nr:MAG: hypothetical protein CM15mP32_5950 [Flavobacteriaceae bacterium]